MISTSAFLDSAFQACALTCDCLVVPRKCVLSVLHQSINYFDKFGGIVVFLKVRCAKCNFAKLQNSQNNSHSAPKMEWSVNYSGVECQLFWSKISIILEILELSVVC
jgi:hypothetical protein